jgi:hypothetical protein
MPPAHELNCETKIVTLDRKVPINFTGWHNQQTWESNLSRISQRLFTAKATVQFAQVICGAMAEASAIVQILGELV